MIRTSEWRDVDGRDENTLNDEVEPKGQARCGFPDPHRDTLRPRQIWKEQHTDVSFFFFFLESSSTPPSINHVLKETDLTFMTTVSHLRLDFSAAGKHVISPDSIIVENVGEWV